MTFVCGFTGSLGGQDSLALARLLARSSNADFKVYMILNQEKAHAIGAPEGVYDKILQEAAAEWIDEAEDALGMDDLTCHLHYAKHPADGLLEVCEEVNPTCLVIAGGRHGALGKVSLGSIGNTLVHCAPVPLALAPRGMRHRKIDRIRRITACVGNIEGTTHLLDSTVALARKMNADLRILSLLELPKVAPTDAEALSHEEAEKVCQENLDYLKKRLPDDIQVTTELAKGSSIPEAVERADWREDEICLIGSARMAAPSRLFLGSVANKILRAVPVPLVVIPRTGKEG